MCHVSVDNTTTSDGDAADGTTDASTEVNEPGDEQPVDTPTAEDTTDGDATDSEDNNPILWVVLGMVVLIAAAAAVIVVVLKKKKTK